jgi:hypothetical protein
MVFLFLSQKSITKFNTLPSMKGWGTSGVEVLVGWKYWSKINSSDRRVLSDNKKRTKRLYQLVYNYC